MHARFAYLKASKAGEDMHARFAYLKASKAGEDIDARFAYSKAGEELAMRFEELAMVHAVV